MPIYSASQRQNSHVKGVADAVRVGVHGKGVGLEIVFWSTSKQITNLLLTWIPSP